MRTANRWVETDAVARLLPKTLTPRIGLNVHFSFDLILRTFFSIFGAKRERFVRCEKGNFEIEKLCRFQRASLLRLPCGVDLYPPQKFV